MACKKCGHDVFKCDAIETIHGRAWVDDDHNLIEFSDDYGSVEYDGDFECEECGKTYGEIPTD